MTDNSSDAGIREQIDWRGYLRVLLYAALLGVVMALLAFSFLALLKVGTQFLTQSVPHLLWPGTTFNLTTLLIAIVGSLLVGVAIYYTGEHTGLGVAQKEYAEHGRIEYRHLPSIMAESFLSLWSGASLGPEGPLTDLCGRSGTWIAEKLKLRAGEMRTLVYAAIAGAFGAFFLSPLIGAFIAFEYMSLREIRYERFLLPGIVAACAGYAVYVALPHESLTGIFSFPTFQEPRLIDLLLAVGIGVLGGLISVGIKLAILGVNSAAQPLHERPVVRALAGGVVVGVVGVFLPLTLYSGQSQTEEIVHTYAQIGVISLLTALVDSRHRHRRHCWRDHREGGHARARRQARAATGSRCLRLHSGRRECAVGGRRDERRGLDARRLTTTAPPSAERPRRGRAARRRRRPPPHSAPRSRAVSRRRRMG
jgi:H+/Cl- antiporter ClcA